MKLTQIEGAALGLLIGASCMSLFVGHWTHLGTVVIVVSSVVLLVGIGVRRFKGKL